MGDIEGVDDVVGVGDVVAGGDGGNGVRVEGVSADGPGVDGSGVDDAAGLDVAADIEYGERVHPLLHLMAPLVASGAVWAARMAIGRSYERATGRTRPDPGAQETSWRRAIVWTAVTATSAAVIEVSVRRLANERQVRAVLLRGRNVGGAITGRRATPAAAAPEPSA